ncbi:hypothetical protein GCM10010145_09100 [Streptomyces ruber]|uniref:Uncharacterized protein n=2 Tax=Streptomyces TaxID=1883 RepID=A0A918BBD5_9ACTN|nr:hypothetical protein GCM10010145_09100 [Streptomyces ruber]
MLTGLLDADEGVRSRALGGLHHVVHHQNTLYTATPPAALYVAGILGEARALWSLEKNPHSFPGPMRAELLGWLGSVANEADDEAATTSRRFGFPPEDYPPFVEVCRIRPQLFRATSVFMDDPDIHVREAAVSACIPAAGRPSPPPPPSRLGPSLAGRFGRKCTLVVPRAVHRGPDGLG